MFAIPVSFAKEHKQMLAHCKELLEYKNGMVAIHPRYNKLITVLRTAVENGEGVLDKEATSHDDLLDAFRVLDVLTLTTSAWLLRGMLVD